MVRSEPVGWRGLDGAEGEEGGEGCIGVQMVGSGAGWGSSYA